MTFSHRLKKALNASPLNQSDLARVLQVKPQSVQQWLSGKNFPRRPRVKSIAQHLNVSAVWLSGGEVPISYILQESHGNVNRSATDEIPLLPLLPWLGLSCLPNHSKENATKQKFIHRPCACSNNAFALKIEDNSMYPRFVIGDVIIVDPNIAAIHNAYVVASKCGNSNSVLRQKVVVDGMALLSANNPNWPDRFRKLDKSWLIHGTVVGKYRILSPTS